MSGNGRARIVIADDHKAVLERLATILAEDFTVVATVSDGAELVDAEAALQPDLVVVDLCMPRMTGVEATAAIRGRGSKVPIVWVTSSEPDLLESARELGALGYVNKTALLEDLVPAVRAALNGDSFVSPSRSTRPPRR